MKKRYKITNHFRFITFMTVLTLAVITSVSAVFGCFSITGTETKVSAAETDRIVIVESGDSLWEIAVENSEPGTDIRKKIYSICKANNIYADDIRPGMSLIIPA